MVTISIHITGKAEIPLDTLRVALYTVFIPRWVRVCIPTWVFKWYNTRFDACLQKLLDQTPNLLTAVRQEEQLVLNSSNPDQAFKAAIGRGLEEI